MYFDRLGNPVTVGAWSEQTRSNRDVARDTVGGCCVATVFTGLDPEYDIAPFTHLPPERKRALIFETATCGEDGNFEVLRRYSSAEDALAGHQQVVAELESGKRAR